MAKMTLKVKIIDLKNPPFFLFSVNFNFPDINYNSSLLILNKVSFSLFVKLS